ncbi:UNVERIFIED_CONTAM: hypothetical protein Sradi_3798000 [Sesamum radiatum]|uniref:CCHC-type domain-containing protein n=1 Tax=Sesamum radiatum TaxID=300843 RepID=A0AAW2Q099_SESRA
MGEVDRELERLKRNLNLTKTEESGVLIADGLWNNDTDSHNLCLIGRVLTSKAYRFKAFSTSISGMLNPVKAMDCQKLSGGRFYFDSTIIDRDRALDGSPWSFDRNIVVLNMIQEHENPLHVDLNCCDFHVHIYDLLLSKMTLGVAGYIGNRLGRFKQMDMDDSGCSWGATLRMRVSLDVNIPLQRAMKVRTTSGDEHLVTFSYERLTNFCYFCGRLGHISKYCKLPFAEGFSDPGTDTPYGAWLRAPLPTRRATTSVQRATSLKGKNPAVADLGWIHLW